MEADRPRVSKQVSREAHRQIQRRDLGAFMKQHHIWPIMAEFQLSEGPSVSHRIANITSLQLLFDHFIILYERR